MRNNVLSRRRFLKLSGLATCGAAIHHVMSPGLITQAFAQAQNRAVISGAHLFVINLAGGVSYNIAPIYNSAWRDKNPTVSYSPESSLPLTNNSDQGFHPSLPYFKQLFDAGDLALLNQVSFPSNVASRSHEDAAQMWMTASVAPNGKSGILNGVTCRLSGSGFFKGVSLAGAPAAVEGGCSEMRKLQGLSSLEGRTLQYNTDATSWLHIQRKEMFEAGTSGNNPSSLYIRSAIENMDNSADQISQTLSGSNLPNVGVNPPGGGFGTQVSDAMKIFQASNLLGTKIYYLETGGFDTHSAERNNLPERLAPLNQGVQYISEVAKALGRWDQVIILVFSEFCRTFENSAAGTDHGEVAPAFLMGGRINGRQVNPAPTNTKILASNSFIRGPEIDTRSLWYNIVYNGMGLNPAGLLDSSGYSTANLNLFS